MKPQTTTSDLPYALRQQGYYIRKPIPGGPRYAMPQYGQGQVDFSRMKSATADALIAAGYTNLGKRDPVIATATDAVRATGKKKKAAV